MSENSDDMKLKHDGYCFSTENPFEDDRLNRSEFAETLSNFVSKIAGSLTISVNGAWGTGKTFFLQRWQQRLQNDGFTTIYFSAWEDDHCEDALLALLGQIWSNIKDNDWKKTLNEVALPILKDVVRNALKKGVSIASGGIVEVDENKLKSQAGKMLEEYAASTAKLKETKTRLFKASKQCYEKTEKPLVIIIDELDRCRPLFAIELLEKIKHFFDIPGIIFVLGIDREQLGHSIRSVYGNIDVDGYLRRFIDLEFLLDTPDDTQSFFQSLFQKYASGMNGFEQNDIQPYSDWAALVSQCFGLSLREMEFLARTVVVGSTAIPRTIKVGTQPYGDHNSMFLKQVFHVWCVLIALKLRDEEFYKKIIGDEGINASEIVDRLITKLNAWRLFFIDPVTKTLMRDTVAEKDRRTPPAKLNAISLLSAFYTISPDTWQQGIGRLLNDKSYKPAAEDQYFYIITRELLVPERRLQSSHAPYFKDLLRCLEMIKPPSDSHTGQPSPHPNPSVTVLPPG